MTGALELLDLIARKGTKMREPLINDPRPLSVRALRKKRKVQSMSDPKVREFFGAGQIQYTPRAPDPSQLTPRGGGWYQLPDGSKVQGHAKALAQLEQTTTRGPSAPPDGSESASPPASTGDADTEPQGASEQLEAESNGSSASSP